jgi:hypothetical protein
VQFYLGTHLPNWLALTDVPLFVSRRRLAGRRALPRALGPWALDSGGFSELSMFGEWQTSPAQYAAEVKRYSQEIGGMGWAAIQDWMCEPFMLAKTGLSIHQHQQRTVQSYLRLRDLAPEQPWVPVLQGWLTEDYLRHVEQYAAAGVDLSTLERVGLGSVCRRQGSAEIHRLVSSLQPLRLHGFGVKAAGIQALGGLLASCDSMAWSFRARRAAPLPECLHRNCANCIRYALRWRDKILKMVSQTVDRPAQLVMNLEVAA